MARSTDGQARERAAQVPGGGSEGPPGAGPAAASAGLPNTPKARSSSPAPTTSAASASQAWVVSFEHGITEPQGKTITRHVRAVRGP